MTNDVGGLGRWLFVVGAGVALVGVVLMCAPRLPWLGRLPGDIRIERSYVTFCMPLGTCLLLSLVGSLILWVIGRCFR